jgi:ABC-type sulfate/molybdate transport systems ATPase subunit
MLALNISSFAYKEIEIIKDVSFELPPGEQLAILGESGSGKSTLLHIIYGLLHLEKGNVTWKTKKLLGPTHNLIPGEPFIKLVSQEFDLMPFTTAADNIATHLSRRDLERDDQRVQELLRVVDMELFGDVLVKTLSGGQKQRVALAKALAKEPELLLLDEPFSNIDTFRKNTLRRNLFQYLKEKNISCITATHDSEEALAFSDRVLMLKNGKTQLFGTPEAVYGAISSSYQAGFFGEVNRISASVFSSEEIPQKVGDEKKEIILLPHQLKVSEDKTKLKVTVKKAYFKGSYYLIHCEANSLDFFVNHTSYFSKGQIIYLDRNSIKK